MTPSHSQSIRLAALFALLAAGCGSSSPDSPITGGGTGGAPSGSGGTAPGSGGTPTGGTSAAGAGGQGGVATSAGGSPTGGSTGAGGTTGTGGSEPGAGGAATCASPNAWDVTYNLDGSTFEIRDTPLGAGNQVNTCTAPYTADNQIGPGTMTLRFPDAGGAPGPGAVHLMAYDMDLEFTVAGATNVHTVLTQQGAVGACGAASGTYAGAAIKWSDPGMNMHTVGDVTCTGTLCSLGGLPDGTPQHRDDTSPQALFDFTFSNGVSSFVMAAVLNTKDSTSSEWMTFKGAETGRKTVCDCQ